MRWSKKLEVGVLQAEAECKRSCTSNRCAYRELTAMANLRDHDSPFVLRACPGQAVSRTVRFRGALVLGVPTTSGHDGRVTPGEIDCCELRSLEAEQPMLVLRRPGLHG